MNKPLLATTLLLLVLGPAARAADAIVISGPHNCCEGCKNAAAKAVDGLRDVSVDEKKGTITAKGKSSAKKAVEALMEKGFYASTEGGESKSASESSSAAAEKPATGSAARKVKSATVTGVHNCCLKCRNMIMDAVREVPGVASAEVEVKAESFKVQGDFSKDDLLAALNKAGFNGKVK